MSTYGSLLGKGWGKIFFILFIAVILVLIFISLQILPKFLTGLTKPEAQLVLKKPSGRWLRPDGSLPNPGSKLGGCITLVFNDSNCQGDVIGNKSCGPCSTDGTGVCYEIIGTQTERSWRSEADCFVEGCGKVVPNSCQRPSIRKTEQIYESTPAGLLWLPNQKNRSCAWKRNDNSLPVGRTGNCLVRFYSQLNCQGEIIGYSNCAPAGRCSEDGTGICVEVEETQKIPYSSVDVSFSIPPKEGSCELGELEGDTMVAKKYSYLLWKCN